MSGPRGDEAALAAITHRAYQHGYEQALAVLKTQVENATARARAYEAELRIAEARIAHLLAELARHDVPGYRKSI